MDYALTECPLNRGKITRGDGIAGLRKVFPNSAGERTARHRRLGRRNRTGESLV